MKDFVQELVRVVSGSANGKTKKTMFKSARNKLKALKQGEITAPVKKSHSKNIVADRSKEVRPEQVIPMDDDNFTDF